MARRDDSATQQQAEMPPDAAANDQRERTRRDNPDMRPEEAIPASKRPATIITDWASI
jgi:hypothetical protein